MASIENKIRDLLNQKQLDEAAFPGMGKNKEAEPMAQGSSEKSEPEVLELGSGAAAKMKQDMSMASSGGAKESEPMKQGSSEDASIESKDDQDTQGKTQAAKMKKDATLSTAHGAGAAPNFTTHTDPASVVNQASNAGNVYKEEVEETEEELISEEEFNALSDEEKAEYELVEMEEVEEAKKEEMEDEEEEEMEDEESPMKKKKEEMMKKMKEELSKDVANLLSTESELSEEFKTKAATIFESAVNVKVAEKVAEIKEEYNTKLAETTKAIQEKVESTTDMYISYVVENWIKENEVAITNGLKNELFEDFLSGLKALFETHNISVPEEKIDIAEKAVSELEEANEQLDSLMSENAKLVNEINALRKNKIVSEAVAGLTLVDSELLVSLSETVEFTNEDEFRKKLETLREAHCNKKDATETKKLVMEDVVEPTIEEEKNIDSSMKRYLDVISRTSK